MEKKLLVRPQKTVLEVMPGCDYSNACIQAVRIAIERWENVEFTFNGKTYFVTVNDVISVPQLANKQA